LRLKIKLKKDNFEIPVNYQGILQGFIYNTFERSKLGNFYHNSGFVADDKIFKLFVFSNIYGKYKLINKKFIFENNFVFFIASMDEEFISSIYNYLLINDEIILNNQKVLIEKIDIIDSKHFFNEKEIILRTLSPVVTYRTEDNYFHYYSPNDKEFYEIVSNNIKKKYRAYYNDELDFKFKIEEVESYKERIVKFKNTTYKAYIIRLKVKVNYETLEVILNSGLSAKGSCGFGMMEVIN